MFLLLAFQGTQAHAAEASDPTIRNISPPTCEQLDRMFCVAIGELHHCSIAYVGNAEGRDLCARGPQNDIDRVNREMAAQCPGFVSTCTTEPNRQAAAEFCDYITDQICEI